ncbi:hypothetical protein BH20ACT18_BH20ACT18_02070 [soil metagenome]
MAAAGFGAALVAFDAAAEHGVAWTLLASRCTSVPLVVLAIGLARPSSWNGTIAPIPLVWCYEGDGMPWVGERRSSRWRSPWWR